MFKFTVTFLWVFIKLFKNYIGRVSKAFKDHDLAIFQCELSGECFIAVRQGACCKNA